MMNEDEIFEEIDRSLERDDDDGQAAKSHLADGRPIYYCEDAYPDAMLRKWPDGRRELVTYDADGILQVLMPLKEA